MNVADGELFHSIFCNHLLILELVTSRKQLILYVQQVRILSLVNFIVVLGKINDYQYPAAWVYGIPFFKKLCSTFEVPNVQNCTSIT